MSQEFKFNFCVGQIPKRLVAEVVPAENAPEVLKGKFVEFEVPDSIEEMPDCFQIVKITSPPDAPLLSVPDGLTRCPVCNEYRGVMALKDIPNLDPSFRDVNPDTPLRVQCICDGVLCHRCKVNRFHRPTTNVWTERGGFFHIPDFRALFPCDDCNEKRNEEAAARTRRRIEQRLATDKSNPT
jgi:hypothetical protein